MADGTITIDTRIDTSKLNNQLKQVELRIEAQKTKVQELEAKYQEWQRIAAAQQKNFGSVSDATTQGVEQSRLAYEQARASLEGMEIKSDGLRDKIQQAEEPAEELPNAFDNASKSLEKFGKRLGTMAKKVLVFSLILKALRSIKEYMGKLLKSNEDFQKSVAQLKGALLTAFQPLWQVIQPALTAFISLLARAAKVIAQVLSFIFGTNAKDSAKSAKALNDQANAIDAVGGAAKEAKKQLSGLDEMNTWQSDKSSGGGGGGGSIKPDFSLFDDTQKHMSELEIYMSGALLALGAILTFTGVSVPLGLGLMFVGGVGLAKALSADWDTMPKNLKKALTKTLATLGGALLVIGAILTFTGANIPLGIGLMLAGAASLGTAIALNWNAILDKLKEVWSGITSWFNAKVKPKFTKQFWQEKFDCIKTALADKIKGGVNAAITLFNKFVDWLNQKMNISWSAVKIAGATVIPKGSFQLLKLNKIPMLAEGGVIPANHAFLSVLGDQKNGKNIEAPEDLIRKIVREETGNGSYTFIAQLDGKTIFKEVINQAKISQSMNGRNAFKLGGSL